MELFTKSLYSCRTSLLLSFLLISFLCACSTRQIISTVRDHNVSLKRGDLETHGVGFLTPSTVTGQEEDKQALGMIFADVIKEEKPDMRCITLPEILSSVNRNGLADEYRQMFEDYRFTNIFKKNTLKKVGDVADVRYLLQIKLANFTQRSQGRFSVLGLRLVQTKEGNIRLFATIWDSWDGSIVWEGMQELNYAYDTIREKPISFKKAVNEAAEKLVSRLP